ncbi:UDP-glucuronosyltransferase 1-2-like [Stylophora pistillata]|uniref:UDP-glucuronosyltransferase 2B1 n=1 Tax=Stylophora pistillata TaxID=50429 RepID=A0A2B4REH9_STYPI|nr:UDP-glucuronosyltransferase 1-2-like [Stylophora pistillata]PFX14788.1 UDP-glucuronosyltransferase 2B1 [Stylophora pistillata]
MALKAMIVLLVTLVTVNSSLSARIAGFSGTNSGSHCFTIKKVMEEMFARGHEVVLVKPANQNDPPTIGQRISHKIFNVPYDQAYFEEYFVKTVMEDGIWKAVINFSEMQSVICELLLNNTELIQYLRKFDLIVFERLFMCASMVADLLKIPAVVLIPSPNAPVACLHFKVPCLFSYVPSRLSAFTSDMSFIQRVMNTVTYINFGFAMHILQSPSFCRLKEKYNIAPEKELENVLGNADLVLILGDFALEYPQPLLPGQVMVGPITAKAEPDPLPPDLANIIDSSGGHGFIIASFGSYAETIISHRTINVLAVAFGKLKQKVIWKLKGYIPSHLGANIKVVKWIPQNDLLAHKDIKAFVSHVGHSSLYESVYHGVPVVAVPLFADQFFNAGKVEHFGLGITVDHQTVTTEDFVKTIENVITEPSFKKNAMRISRLMKDSPRTPLEKAGDWIEYVHRHSGAQHLRAQVFNIPWYQYYLLDVIAFLVAIVAFVVMVIRWTCRCMCRVCFRPSSEKAKND